jgi:hypothetical protein
MDPGAKLAAHIYIGAKVTCLKLTRASAAGLSTLGRGPIGRRGRVRTISDPQTGQRRFVGESQPPRAVPQFAYASCCKGSGYPGV